MISDNDKKSSFSAGSNIQLNGQSPCSTGVSTVAQTHTLQDKENLVTDHPDEYIIRQRKRRAEMSDEQRQDINTRQREYRARKKAESNQNTENPETVLHPTFAGF